MGLFFSSILNQILLNGYHCLVMSKKEWNKIIWVAIFSIAMAYLETSVVIYLRYLYYPDGFSFPIKVMDTQVAIFELWREAATIVMLISIGALSGKSKLEKFAYFLISFALWDIFYYVFLYITLGWPSSLLTWDLLFLIPIPWIGPVVGPIIVSLFLILFGLTIIRANYLSSVAAINRTEWLLLFSGSLVVILSWTIEYFMFVITHIGGKILWSLTEEEILSISTEFVPKDVYWFTFSLGVALISLAIFLFHKRYQTST